MKVAICGSRDYPDLEQVREYVRGLPPGTVVVSQGESEGVAKVAAQEAKASGLNVELWYARPDLHGSGAGWAQHRALAHAAHRFAVFYDGESKGTPHLIACIQDMGKPVDVYGPRSEPS